MRKFKINGRLVEVQEKDIKRGCYLTLKGRLHFFPLSGKPMMYDIDAEKFIVEEGEFYVPFIGRAEVWEMVLNHQNWLSLPEKVRDELKDPYQIHSLERLCNFCGVETPQDLVNKFNLRVVSADDLANKYEEFFVENGVYPSYIWVKHCK